MNPFAWLTRQVKNACVEGLRQFFAEVHPEAPPADLAELRALVAEPPPALPAADDKEPAKKPTRGPRA